MACPIVLKIYEGHKERGTFSFVRMPQIFPDAGDIVLRRRSQASLLSDRPAGTITISTQRSKYEWVNIDGVDYEIRDFERPNELTVIKTDSETVQCCLQQQLALVARPKPIRVVYVNDANQVVSYGHFIDDLPYLEQQIILRPSTSAWVGCIPCYQPEEENHQVVGIRHYICSSGSTDTKDYYAELYVKQIAFIRRVAITQTSSYSLSGFNTQAIPTAPSYAQIPTIYAPLPSSPDPIADV